MTKLNPQNSNPSGVTVARPLPYTPPKGPASQTHKGPGIGGTNHGNNPSKGK